MSDETISAETVIDWDLDVEADPEEEYEALARSLQWTEGFGLFFVRCSPVKGQELIANLQKDLPQKRIKVIELSERTDNLYDLLAEVSDRFDIAIVRGLEASFTDYIQPGYGGEGNYYKLDSVPRVLGNLNLQRERFRDELNLCVVFFLPLFGLKYFIRRAPDFYDWRSGTFEFFTKEEHLREEMKRNFEILQNLEQKSSLFSDIERRNFLQFQESIQNKNSSLDHIIKSGFETVLLFCNKILEIQPNIQQIWNERGKSLYGLDRYEEAIASYDRALKIQSDNYKIWYQRGIALIALEDFLEAANSFVKVLEIRPDYAPALYIFSSLYSIVGESDKALDMLEQAIATDPQYLAIAAEDEDLKSLHDHPRFQKLLENKE